mgnify:CR=1 FL=1
MQDWVVLGTRKRAEGTGAGGVTHGVVGCVGPRAAVDQVIAALAFDDPRAFRNAAIAGLPL